MACPHARCKSGVARRAAGRRPYRLRYLLAWDHALARAVLGVYVRVLLGFQSHRARRRGILDGRSGCVTVIQCFGGGLNLNLHFHTLLFEGVFFAGTRTARLISGPCRLRRTRRSASCWRGSLRGCSVCSNAAGSKPAMPTCCRPIRWWNTRPPWPASAAPRSRGASRSVLARGWVLSTAPRHAHLVGFDLHANVEVPAADRPRLVPLSAPAGGGAGPAAAPRRWPLQPLRHVWVQEVCHELDTRPQGAGGPTVFCVEAAQR